MSNRGLVSVDGEEYVPRRAWEEVQAERDRLAKEVERLEKALAEKQRDE